MAISDDLNSIRTHLEDDYTALETLGVSVEDRNIENIKDMANQIYAKFPKTNYAEGSNITLSNTLKGKLDFEDGIVGIGDTKQNSYEGYNLANYTGGEYTSNSLSNLGAFNLSLQNSIEISTSKTYFYSADIKLNSGTATTMNLIRSGNNSGQATTPVTNPNLSNNYQRYVFRCTYTTSQTLTQIAFQIGNNVTNAIISVKNLMVSEENKDFEPFVGNSPSPSPSYPQDIEVVRGKNVVDWANVNYTGQNGATITRTGSEYSVTSAGQFAFAQFSQEDLKLKPNTNYVFRAKIKSTETSNGSVIRVNPLMTVTGSEIYSSRTTSGNIAKIAFTTPSTIPSNAAVGLYPYEVSKTIVFTDIMICEGTDVNTPYLPYNTLEVVERGKNLLPNNWTSGSISSSTGEAVPYGSRIYTTNKIKVKPNTTYIVNNHNTSSYSIRNLIDSYTSNGTHIERIGDIANGLTFTTSANVGYINITLADVSDTLRYENFTEYLTNGTLKPILAEGTDDTYEPYQTPQTYQLSLGEYEFAKIGNYVDTIEYDVDEDKVYKVEKIEKNQMLNTWSWSASAVGTNSYSTTYYRDNTDIGKTGSEINIMCTHAKGIKFEDRNSFTYTTIYDETNGVVIFRNTGITSLADFKTFLSNNGVFSYNTSTTSTKIPITTILKDQIKALYNSHSFTGTTIIEIDGQLPLIIKVRALKGN